MYIYSCSKEFSKHTVERTAIYNDVDRPLLPDATVVAPAMKECLYDFMQEVPVAKRLVCQSLSETAFVRKY